MKLETYNFVWNYPNSLNRKKLNSINKWTKIIWTQILKPEARDFACKKY